MLSIGIVGLPNVGKSTLFNALTKKCVPAENYPFCTIEPSVGIVPVPDERLYKLSEISQSKETIPAVVQFVDIAGLVEGAASGEGLGNKFLSHIREVDAIAEVVRIFPIDEESGVTHVHGKIDPLHDINVINLELVLADLETLTKRLANLEKEIKRGDKDAKEEAVVLKKLESIFESGKLAREAELSTDEENKVKHLNLLTFKPIIYVLNKKEGVLNLDETDEEAFKKLVSFVESSGSQYAIVDVKTEEEMKDMNEDEKRELKAGFGDHLGVDTLIRESYRLLNLITFFTTGEKETRAWTIKVGSTAPEAGSAIHSDFHDKFIRADVIGWKYLVDIGSYAEARTKGVVRTEGKDYIVEDGDVIEFRI